MVYVVSSRSARGYISETMFQNRNETRSLSMHQINSSWKDLHSLAALRRGGEQRGIKLGE